MIVDKCTHQGNAISAIWFAQNKGRMWYHNGVMSWLDVADKQHSIEFPMSRVIWNDTGLLALGVQLAGASLMNPVVDNTTGFYRDYIQPVVGTPAGRVILMSLALLGLCLMMGYSIEYVPEYKRKKWYRPRKQAFVLAKDKHLIKKSAARYESKEVCFHVGAHYLNPSRLAAYHEAMPLEKAHEIFAFVDDDDFITELWEAGALPLFALAVLERAGGEFESKESRPSHHMSSSGDEKDLNAKYKGKRDVWTSQVDYAIKGLNDNKEDAEKALTYYEQLIEDLVDRGYRPDEAAEYIYHRYGDDYAPTPTAMGYGGKSYGGSSYTSTYYSDSDDYDSDSSGYESAPLLVRPLEAEELTDGMLVKYAGMPVYVSKALRDLLAGKVKPHQVVFKETGRGYVCSFVKLESNSDVDKIASLEKKLDALLTKEQQPAKTVAPKSGPKKTGKKGGAKKTAFKKQNQVAPKPSEPVKEAVLVKPQVKKVTSAKKSSGKEPQLETYQPGTVAITPDRYATTVWKITRDDEVDLANNGYQIGNLLFTTWHGFEESSVLHLSRCSDPGKTFTVTLKGSQQSTYTREEDLLVICMPNVNHARLPKWNKSVLAFADPAYGVFFDTKGEIQLRLGVFSSAKNGRIYYNISTAKGDCGSPIFVRGEFVGIHQMGDVHSNSCIPISKERYEHFAKIFSTKN